MFVRDSCSKQLDSDRLAADVPQFSSRPSLVRSVTVVLLSLVTGGKGVRAALRSQAQASSSPFAGGTANRVEASRGRPGYQGEKPKNLAPSLLAGAEGSHAPPGLAGALQREKPRAPPDGGRRGQVELLAHAYTTCAVMSGLDKGP